MSAPGRLVRFSRWKTGVNMHRAYMRPEFRELPYAVLHSGPSATADIEGVLILGAQGVRSLPVVLASRNQRQDPV